MKINFDDLLKDGLVVQKHYPNGLKLTKYHNKVFYKNLWNLDPRLLEARGIITDQDDNIIVWPFTKVFNHHENGVNIPRDQDVSCS